MDGALVLAAIHAVAGVVWVVGIQLPTDEVPWAALVGCALLNLILVLPFVADRLVAVPLRGAHPVMASLVFPSARVAAELVLLTVAVSRAGADRVWCWSFDAGNPRTGRIDHVITSSGPRGWTSSLHRVGDRPVLRWEADRAWRCVSSGVLGGGIGTSRWVLNATVPRDFDDDLPGEYLARLATTVGLAPEAGIGLLTAVDVRAAVTVTRPGVTMSVTTGVGPHAKWPAVHDAQVSEHARAGTVNAVAWFDQPVTPDALVNGVITVTEAKTQAFFEAGIAGTGTCTDTVTLLCPVPAEDEEPTRYLGSRSPVGQALATAAHAAVATGLQQERAAFAEST